MKKYLSTFAAVLLIIAACVGAGLFGRGRGTFDYSFSRIEDEPETVDWDAEHFTPVKKQQASYETKQISFIETIELLPCPCSQPPTGMGRDARSTSSPVPVTMPHCVEAVSAAPERMPYVGDDD